MKKDAIMDLLETAKKACLHSYSPYSRFRVGAALLCSDNTLFTGTNVENRSFGLTVCAERIALCCAITAGKRDFKAIAIYSPDTASPLPPCGACRQVLSEFCKNDFLIIMAGSQDWLPTTMSKVLPFDALHELKRE